MIQSFYTIDFRIPTSEFKIINTHQQLYLVEHRVRISTK
jgi:hypothetical protein